MTSPFVHDFTDKVVVVTGAGGVLCSYFAKEFARAGAKVALLDLNLDNAQGYADEIVAEGGIAKAFKANVLELPSLQAAKEAVVAELGELGTKRYRVRLQLELLGYSIAYTSFC